MNRRDGLRKASPADPPADLRILHVLPSVDSHSGGPVRSSLATVKAVHLVEPRCQQVIASTDYGLDLEWLAELRHRIGKAGNYRIFEMLFPWRYGVSWSMCSWLYRNIESFNLVVVRAALHPTSSLAAMIARHQGVPYVLTPHGCLSQYTFEHRRSGLKQFYYRAVERHTVSGATAIQCTARKEADEIKAREPEARTRVIPHPYDGRWAYPSTSPGQPRILFLSRLDPMKGLDLLLPAFAQVLKQFPAARLILAGAGERRYEREINHCIARLKLGKAVKLPGFVDGAEKERMYREASVFVLPSYRENYGIVVVEAMAHGLPVVVSRNVGIADRIEEEGAGQICQMNVESVASAIITLLQDSEKRLTTGRRGRALVKEDFSLKRVGRLLYSMYEEVAQ